MIVMNNQLELEKAKFEGMFNVRFNPNHAADGKFAPTGGGGAGGSGSAGSGGSGGSGGLSAEDNAKIAELEQKLSETKGFLAKNSIHTEINMIKEGFTGTKEEYLAMKKKKREEEEAEKKKKYSEQQAKEKAKKEKEAAEKKKQLEEELKTQPTEKVEQYKIIEKTNPMQDDYHVGIRKPSDIKTWKEVMDSKDEESFQWGDFSKKDAEKALKTGKVTVYSSKPIEDGNFVSTSKVQAEQYAGGKGNKIYTKEVDLSDVAWINGDEGQFAQTKKRSADMKKNLERRSYDFEVTAESTEKGAVITGRPIVYNSRTNIGLFDEIIESRALANTDLTDVRFLVNHDISKIPLARSRRNNGNSTMQLIPDEKGLSIEVQLDVENNSEARSLYSAVKRGDISGMSFLFSVPKGGDSWENMDTDHPTRHVRSIGSVVEVSAVTFPAYESTEIYARSKEALDNAKLALESAKRSQKQALESESRSELELAKAKFEAIMKVR